MEMSTNITELAKALVKVQSSLKPVLKDSENPFYKSKYADLAAVWESCRKPLTDNGFSVIQSAESENGNVLVKTLLLHESGEFISSCLSLQPVKTDPQGIGSAITYGRRYSLAAIVGISAEEDDDGNASSGVKIPPPKENKTAKPTKKTNTEKLKNDIELAIKDCCKTHDYDTNIFANIASDILCSSYKVKSLHELKEVQLKAIFNNIQKLLSKTKERYAAEKQTELENQYPDMEDF